MRDGAPSSTRPRFVDGDWRGLADFLERQPDGGYEVVDTKLARRARPAHVLQLCFYTEQLARIQGAMPERDARRQRARRARDLPARRTSSPTTGGCARASSPRSRTARDTYPYPVDHCGLCDFLALCKEQWERRRPPHARRRDLAHCRSSGSTAAGITTLERARPTRRRRRAIPKHARRQTLREAPPPGRAPAPPPPHRRAPRRPPPARAGARLRAPARADARATSGSTSRATPGSSRRAGSSTSSAGSSSTTTASRATTASGRATAPRRRRGFERLIDYDRRAPPPLPGHARLPLRALRAHRAHAADGRARHARGRDRRPAARRGARRPLPRHAPGAPRLARRATRSRRSRSSTASSARPRSRGGSESRRRLRGVARDAASSRSSRGSAPTTRRTAVSLYELHRWLLEQRPADLPWRPPPEERERERGDEGAARRARARARPSCSPARRRATRAGCSRSCSSTTAARRSRSGGSTSTTSTLDEEELLEDARHDRRARARRRAGAGQAVARVHVHVPAAGAQDRRRRRSIRRPSKSYHVKVDDEHGHVTLRARQGAADEPLPTALIPPEPLPTWVQRDAVLRFAKDQERYPALVEILERRPPRARLDGTLGRGGARASTAATSSSRGRPARARRGTARGWRSR